MKEVIGLSAAFVSVLSKRRNDLDMSQESFAEKAGIKRTYVSMLERGIHAPSLRANVLIGQVFGLSATELVREVEAALAAGLTLPEPTPRGKRQYKKQTK